MYCFWVTISCLHLTVLWKKCEITIMNHLWGVAVEFYQNLYWTSVHSHMLCKYCHEWKYLHRRSNVFLVELKVFKLLEPMPNSTPVLAGRTDKFLHLKVKKALHKTFGFGDAWTSLYLICFPKQMRYRLDNSDTQCIAWQKFQTPQPISIEVFVCLSRKVWFIIIPTARILIL